jgi:CRISPR-associated protein Cas6/Cse3/CasE subtype I-E
MSCQASYWLSLIKVGYPKKAKRQLRYNLHRLIWKAYPGFQKGDSQPFLFSITGDGDDEGFYCLVQSSICPDWDRVYEMWKEEEELISLTQVVGDKYVTVPVNNGDLFAFRIQASPVKNEFVAFNVRGRKKMMKNKQEIEEWFLRRASRNGFLPEMYEFDYGQVNVRVGGDDKVDYFPLTSCQFDGVLRVKEPENFKEVINGGLGPKKAFGFGMVMVGRA